MSELSREFAHSLFLSYSWNDSELADKIDSELSNCGFDIKRDIRDIGSWKSIREFMSSIRSQDYAIIIVSSSYLKSPNCMYEVMELLKDSQYNDKILSIITPDADIYNPISKANYIKYWEEETKKLEKAIKSLRIENAAELAIELRKYRSIEITISPFLDFVSDRNNPKIIYAVEKIKEIVKTNVLDPSSTVAKKQKENLKIDVNACHYHFIKFASSANVSGTELEKTIGTINLENEIKQEPYDLPMLKCEVTNLSEQVIKIQEPIISGAITLNDKVFNDVTFFVRSETEKCLKPNEKANFVFMGLAIIGIIKAFLDRKIKSIYVEDNFGLRYYVSVDQIDEITNYFKEYCSNLTEMQLRHDKYCIG